MYVRNLSNTKHIAGLAPGECGDVSASEWSASEGKLEKLEQTRRGIVIALPPEPEAKPKPVKAPETPKRGPGRPKKAAEAAPPPPPPPAPESTQEPEAGKDSGDDKSGPRLPVSGKL